MKEECRKNKYWKEKEEKKKNERRDTIISISVRIKKYYGAVPFFFLIHPCKQPKKIVLGVYFLKLRHSR